LPRPECLTARPALQRLRLTTRADLDLMPRALSRTTLPGVRGCSSAHSTAEAPGPRSPYRTPAGANAGAELPNEVRVRKRSALEFDGEARHCGHTRASDIDGLSPVGARRDAGPRTHRTYEVVSAALGSWPRISPAGFFFVCTFTYVRPDSSALRTDASTVFVPRVPLLQGAHRGTITGPDFPRAPLWMWAATPLPVSLLNVSRHAIVPELPLRVIVAVNVPVARRTLPFGLGRSWLALSVVLTFATTET
jgi:hypothetical protein